MAIARDTSVDTTLGASPRTGSHTCAASAVLFVGTKAAAGYATGATYNGVSMTRIADVISGVGEYAQSLFVLTTPATGSNTIYVTVASSIVGWTSSSYTGADTSSQPGASGTNTSPSGTSITSSITTTVDQSWVIGYFAGSRATLTASTGISFVQAQLNNVALGDSNSAQSVGSYSMITTMGSSGTMGSIMAEIKPPGASTTIKTYIGTLTASVKTVLNGTAIASRKTWNGIT